jgi:small-conductance mechanosensitive channel
MGAPTAAFSTFPTFSAFSDIAPENWIVAVLACVVTFATIHGALILLRRRMAQLIEAGRSDKPVAELLSATLSRTSNLAVLAIAVLVGLSLLELPPPWNQRVQTLWFIVLGLQITLYIDRAVSVGTRRYFRQHSADESAPTTVANTLVGWAIKMVLWAIFGLAVLSNLGINVTTFVASLGIGGIAVALAAQNILGDLFASLAIAIDKPFEVGDAIAVAGVSGSVEHVGLKTTRIRADSGEQIVISNADLLKNVVRNYKRMSTRRVQLSFSINPATPAALAAGIPAAIREIVEAQAEVRFDRAHLKALTQEAIEYELVFFMLTSAYGTYMDTQQTILLAVMEKFDQLGVSTGTPLQHLIIERQSGVADAPAPRNDLAEFKGRAHGSR